MSRGAAELLEIYEATGDENAFDEAVAAWEAIVAWNESRGYDLQAEWPRGVRRSSSGARQWRRATGRRAQSSSTSSTTKRRSSRACCPPPPPWPAGTTSRRSGFETAAWSACATTPRPRKPELPPPSA